MNTLKKTLAVLAPVAVVIGVSACTADPETTVDDPTDGADSVADDSQSECDPNLDAALQAWADAGFSGSVSMTTGGEPVCLAAYGLADKDSETPNTVESVFAIGSVSKAFTAAAVADLVESGSLSLDDRAGAIVPGLDGPVADVTVEQLLLHTSGLTGSHGSDHEPLNRDDAVDAISNLELAFEPGSDYAYSNAGYTLLALIVEESSGKAYRDYLTSRILALPDGESSSPLPPPGGFWDGEPAADGPRAVGYLDGGRTDEMGDFDGPHWALMGNGDLAMTTAQLAEWTHAFFTGDVISAKAIEQITTVGFDHGDGTSENPGWVAYDESSYVTAFLMSAGGGGDVGHNAIVVWVPETEQVIAIASNTPAVTAADLLQAIGPALMSGEPVPMPDGSTATPADATEADLAEAAGTYRLQTGGSYSVEHRGEKLTVAAKGADAIAALFPVPVDAFSADDVTAHEDSVLALLAGDSRAGREELEILESELGAVDDVELNGTIVADGELRTYVTVVTGTDSTLLWYALDEQGGIAGVEGPTDPPTLALAPSEDGFGPVDPAGTGPNVAITFDDGTMTITSDDGVTTAMPAE